MSLFGIGSRYYRPFRNGFAVKTRRLMRRFFGRNSAIKGYKRYYLGRYKGGF